MKKADPSTSLRFAQGSLVKAIDPGSLSVVEVTLRQLDYMHDDVAGSLSVVEVTLRQLDYMHDDVTGSLSAVEVCLIFPTCMKKADPSTLLRDPWLSLRTLRLHCVSLRDPWRKQLLQQMPSFRIFRNKKKL